MPELQWLDAVVGGVMGLLLGSFLNVVVHRLPKMMERQWAAESAEWAGQEAPEAEHFNLRTPRSRCPYCQHQIRWFENIPFASYLPCVASALHVAYTSAHVIHWWS